MCQTNHPQAINNPFAMQPLAKPTLTEYARRLAAHLACSETTFVVAAVLASRLFDTKPEFFGESSVHKLMATCAVLAVKTSEDRWFKNKRYATICGFSPRTLAMLEAKVLASLDYRVFVHVECYCNMLTFMKESVLRDDLHPGLVSLTPPAEPQFPIIQNGFEVSSQPCHAEKRKLDHEHAPFTLSTTDNQSKRSRWTDDEDMKLRQLVAEHGNNWPLISVSLPGRNARSCSTRWSGKLKPGLDSGPFSEDEDELLRSLVAQHGNKWTHISSCFGGRRSARQLTDRYHSLSKRLPEGPKVIKCTPPKLSTPLDCNPN
eukprot:c14760_g1_i1.p1 GENE.c14760_g1_i1~~c14760_g1_i1.p1  ORF type:complete len:343 (-),score=49.89 c14760_g1_i1:158-1108(-)